VTLIESKPSTTSNEQTHRGFLENCKVKEVVPLSPDFRRDIHHVLRMDYVADVVMETQELANHSVRQELQARVSIEKLNVLKKYVVRFSFLSFYFNYNGYDLRILCSICTKLLCSVTLDQHIFQPCLAT